MTGHKKEDIEILSIVRSTRNGFSVARQNSRATNSSQEKIYHFRVSSACCPMNPQVPDGSEQLFRAKVVGLIIDGRAELALKLLSKYYAVSEPALKIGTVKRHRRVLACYLEKERRIYLSKSEYITNPFVILHEFYHHLRASQIMKRGQVEKRADLFATNFIRDFVSQHQLTRGGNG